ncbi:MAG: hypothetical protein Kow0058_05760 [Roseovarius sp.]
MSAERDTGAAAARRASEEETAGTGAPPRTGDGTGDGTGDRTGDRAGHRADDRADDRAGHRADHRADDRAEGVALSIVLPAHDEAGNLPGLIARLDAVAAPLAAEIVVVDDGSADGTRAVLEELMRRHPRLRALRHPRPLGQSAALRSGIRAARGALVATLDADGQNPPEEIPRLVAAWHAAPAGTGLVQGERARRRDSLSKRFGSRFANALRGALLRDGTRDSGCAMRVFRRDAWLSLPWFRHLHRFTPALMKREGWGIVTVPVAHAERGAGRSHYNNWQRALAGLVDLFGVAWLIWRGVAQPAQAWRAVEEIAPTPQTAPDAGRRGET